MFASSQAEMESWMGALRWMLVRGVRRCVAGGSNIALQSKGTE